jgi:hypothetical protein
VRTDVLDRTFGQQASKFRVEIALSRRQINLLSSFTEWVIMSNKELFLKFIDDVPKVVRKRKNMQTCVNILESDGFA